MPDVMRTMSEMEVSNVAALEEEGRRGDGHQAFQCHNNCSALLAVLFVSSQHRCANSGDPLHPLVIGDHLIFL